MQCTTTLLRAQTAADAGSLGIPTLGTFHFALSSDHNFLGRQTTARAAGRCRVPALALFLPRRSGEQSRRRAVPPALSLPPPPGRRPKARRAPLRGSSVTLGAGAPRQRARRRRSPRCSSLSAAAPAATAATLAAAAAASSSSSASKRRFLQPGREVLCQESSGRDWLGPCSPGSPAGARAQSFVRAIGSWKTRKSTKEAMKWKRKDLRNMEAKSPRQKGGFQEGKRSPVEDGQLSPFSRICFQAHQ
ncbi:uncharacterized protein LOC129560791 [Moschus berezovskii]|uniref:uncharacterized protein LOC129560791 n=1 Tax=Moschus berezovskii TaxID=68408 RepID=UPI0024447D84|nr:uncharacterized protein LOC129560791 [Moschus berezovskii]